MDLYEAGNAVDIRYPLGPADAQHLAKGFAARRDELVDVSTSPFSAMVGADIPTTDINSDYIGREHGGCPSGPSVSPIVDGYPMS